MADPAMVGSKGPDTNPRKGVINDWISKDDLQGYFGVPDGPNSGGAIDKALGDDTFSVRSGGTMMPSSGADAPPRGVVNTPMDYNEPGK